VVGVTVPQAAVDRLDLALEVVDQCQRGGEVAPPGLGDVEPGEQLAALKPEQV
jgi:hypothetical protein